MGGNVKDEGGKGGEKGGGKEEQGRKKEGKRKKALEGPGGRCGVLIGREGVWCVRVCLYFRSDAESSMVEERGCGVWLFWF